MAKGLLVAGLDFSKVDEKEFNDWYDTEHLPERIHCAGFLNGQRWLSVENPRVSIATYDLAHENVLKEPGYQAIGYDNLTPWSKRVVKMCGRVLKYEGYQTVPGDQVAPEANALLLFGMNVEPAFEAEFNDWYNKEHLPGLAAVPGVLCARRFLASSTTCQKYLALYHLTSPDVVGCPEWLKATETPWTMKVRPRTSDRLRIICRRYVPKG
jgi:hypothetical protein